MLQYFASSLSLLMMMRAIFGRRWRNPAFVDSEAMIDSTPNETGNVSAVMESRMCECTLSGAQYSFDSTDYSKAYTTVPYHTILHKQAILGKLLLTKVFSQTAKVIWMMCGQRPNKKHNTTSFHINATKNSF